MDKLINDIGATAFVIAAYRYLEKDQKIPLFTDNYAKYFVSDSFIEKAKAFRQIIPEGEEMIRYRTRFFLDKTQEEIKKGVEQIVLLGNGFDMSALELYQKDVHFFDVDQKPVLAFKKSLIEKNKINYPARFVPCNYITDQLIDELKKQGFDCEKRTLFTWAGNTMYLPEELIFKFLKTLTKEISSFRLAFDFLDKRVITDETNFDVGKQAREFFANMGAPWVTGFTTLDRFHNDLSFKTLENTLMSSLKQKYSPESEHNKELFNFYSIAVLEN